MLNYLDDALVKQVVQSHSMHLGDEGGDVTIIIARMAGAGHSRREQRMWQSTLVRYLLVSALEKELGREHLQHCELRKLHNGKPVLYSSQQAQTILPAISLSHSHDFIACAWSRRLAVGIDIEWMRPRNWGSLQDTLLHPMEKEWMMEVPIEEQAFQYYCLWCLKEAFYKVLPLDRETVMAEICFSREHVLIEVPEVLYPISGWKTYVHLLAPEGVVVAVVWRN